MVWVFSSFQKIPMSSPRYLQYGYHYWLLRQGFFKCLPKLQNPTPLFLSNQVTEISYGGSLFPGVKLRADVIAFSDTYRPDSKKNLVEKVPMHGHRVEKAHSDLIFAVNVFLGSADARVVGHELGAT